MKESKIEEAVCQYAVSEYSAEVRKLHYVGRKGAPDRMIFFPSGRVLFIEFKAPGKKPRPDQVREIDRLRRSFVAADIVDNVDQGKLLVDRYAAFK
jgi:hypothetical protein